MGSSDLTQIMHDGLSMSLLEFVSQMLKRICNPANPSRTSRTDKIHGPGQTPVSRDGLRQPDLDVKRCASRMVAHQSPHIIPATAKLVDRSTLEM